MILVDTSIWIGHFRSGNDWLHDHLEADEVATHPFIVGELACGHLTNRGEILELLETLPQVVTASHKEILYFIEAHKLYGLGIGLIDAHIIASALLSETFLWSEDKKLLRAAEGLGVRTISPPISA